MIQSVYRLGRRARKEGVFFLYSLSALALNAATMVAALFSLRYVPPELMGIWQTLTLIQTYANVLNLGVLRGLNRELPFYLGRGERDRAHSLAATAQTYVIVIGVAGAALAVGSALQPGLSVEWRLALLGFSVYWLTSLYRGYLTVTFRAEAEFRRLTKRNFIEFGLTLASLILVVVGGYPGMILRFVLLGIVMTILFHTIRPIRVKPGFRSADFRLLMSTGIPIFISGYLLTASQAFDQTIILQRGSINLVGLYTPVAAVNAIMLALRASISSYVAPQMVFQLGRHSEPGIIGRGVLKSLVITVAITMPVVAVGLLAVPVIVPALFPQYASSMDALQISLVGGLFLAVDFTLMGLNSLKAWRWLFVYSAAALIARWSVPWLLSAGGDALTSVALGSVIANVFVVSLGSILVRIAIRTANHPTPPASPSPLASISEEALP